MVPKAGLVIYRARNACLQGHFCDDIHARKCVTGTVFLPKDFKSFASAFSRANGVCERHGAIAEYFATVAEGQRISKYKKKECIKHSL